MVVMVVMVLVTASVVVLTVLPFSSHVKLRDRTVQRKERPRKRKAASAFCRGHLERSRLC